MIRAGGGTMRRRTGLPLNSTRSPNEMRWPVCAGSPLTVMRPSAIASSMSRREPTPACASTLWSLGASASGARIRLLVVSSLSGSSATSVSNSPDSTWAKTSVASTGTTGWR
jgi:hypothetical protein